jgi:hypothetical protein
MLQACQVDILERRETGLVAVHIVGVLTPFPDIAVHVVKTPSILLQSSYWPTIAIGLSKARPESSAQEKLTFRDFDKPKKARK